MCENAESARNVWRQRESTGDREHQVVQSYYKGSHSTANSICTNLGGEFKFRIYSSIPTLATVGAGHVIDEPKRPGGWVFRRISMTFLY